MRIRHAERGPNRDSAGLRSFARELARPWNLMSLVRMPLAVLVLVYRSELSMMLALMAAAACSDALDGALARRAHADPQIGAWLDPLCDKAFVVALLVAIALVHEPPWWLVALTAVRELIVVPLVLAHWILPGRARRHIEYRARPSGKATTVAQFIVIAAVLLDRNDVAVVASVFAALIGLFAGTEYAMRATLTLGSARAGSSAADLSALRNEPGTRAST